MDENESRYASPDSKRLAAQKVLALARLHLNPKAILLNVPDDEDVVEIGVPVPDYGDAMEKLYGRNKGEIDLWNTVSEEYGLDLRVRHSPPSLVQARLNDFVVTYQDFSVSEDDMGTGIVTAKYVTGKETCYGCRHIVSNIGMKCGAPLNFDPVFLLTDDDYGGHPTGFYRVISQEEAVRRVKAALDRDVKKAMELIKTGRDNADKAIALLLRDKVITKAEMVEDKE